MPLSADEAYYWVWSKALAGGYLDHPPMVALWIRAGTSVFGDTPLGGAGASGRWRRWPDRCSSPARPRIFGQGGAPGSWRRRC